MYEGCCDQICGPAAFLYELKSDAGGGMLRNAIRHRSGACSLISDGRSFASVDSSTINLEDHFGENFSAWLHACEGLASLMRT